MNTLPDSSLVWTCASVYTSAGSREWSTKSHGNLSTLSPSISDTQAHFASPRTKQAQQASKESYTSNPNVALYGFCCCSSDLHPKEPHLPKSKISLPKSIHIISGKTDSVYLQKAKIRVRRRKRRKRKKKEIRPIQTWYKARVPSKPPWVVHRARRQVWYPAHPVPTPRSYGHQSMHPSSSNPFYSITWGRHGSRRFHALQRINPMWFE